jgi:hypothetical protein
VGLLTLKWDEIAVGVEFALAMGFALLGGGCGVGRLGRGIGVGGGNVGRGGSVGEGRAAGGLSEGRAGGEDQENGEKQAQRVRPIKLRGAVKN